MKNNFRPSFSFVGALLVLLLLASNLFGGTRIDQPKSVFYHRFASAVTGPEATWINPAGLALNQKLNIQYIAMFHDGDFTNDWGTAFSGDGFGISFRSVEEFNGSKYEEYIYGGGVDAGRGLYLGGSYRYIKTGFGHFNKRHFWNFGLIYDNHPQFNMAALFSNLNRGEVNGEKSDMEQLYSVSYRTRNEKLTISVETSLSSEQSLSDAKYRYGVDWQVKPNLKIYASYNNDKFYQIGFRLMLQDFFLGTQSRAEAINNDHLGTSVYTGYIKTLRAP